MQLVLQEILDLLFGESSCGDVDSGGSETLEVVLVRQEVEVARSKLLAGTLLIRHWGGPAS